MAQGKPKTRRAMSAAIAPLVSPKNVGRIAHAYGAPAAKTARFDAPSPLSGFTFTLPQLAASIARVCAHRGASATVTAAMVKSAEAFLDAFVDASSAQLTVNTEVNFLNDSTRTNFSAELGAGIADLYMVNLGYVYRCNGREYFPKGKVFDFVYDGPPTNNLGVVVTEAKGSVSKKSSVSSLASLAASAYQAQVSPHVGATVATRGGRVRLLHGYATAVGGKPGAPKCHMHVVETPPSGRPSKTVPHGRSGELYAGPPGSGTSPGDGDTLRADARVVLANYRAVFKLMNTQAIVRAVDAVLSGEKFNDEELEALHVIEWRGERYMVKRSGVSERGTGIGLPVSLYFGLRFDVAKTILDWLPDVPRALQQSNLSPPLPLRPLDLDREREFDDLGAEMPDGLAFFGVEKGEVQPLSQWIWSPLSGITVVPIDDGVLRTFREEQLEQQLPSRTEIKKVYVERPRYLTR